MAYVSADMGGSTPLKNLVNPPSTGSQSTLADWQAFSDSLSSKTTDNSLGDQLNKYYQDYVNSVTNGTGAPLSQDSYNKLKGIVNGDGSTGNGSNNGGTSPLQNLVAPPQTPVANNSALISQQYDQSLQATLNALRQSIAQGVGDQQDIINKAPSQFNPLKDQASYQGAQNMNNLQELLANNGQQGGVNRTEETQVNASTQNALNSLNQQQQDVIDTANKTIAQLQAAGSMQEAQAVAQNASDKLKALTDEANRVDSATYSRAQDAFNNSTALRQLADSESNSKASQDMAAAGLTGTYNGSPTIAGKELADNEAQTKVANDSATAKAVSDANQQAITNAWAKVNATGTVDADSAKILGIPQGTSTLDAQKYKLDSDLAVAGVTGMYNGQPTLDGKKFDWDTNLVNNPQNASAIEALKEDKAKFSEWQKEAPTNLAILKSQLSAATTAEQLGKIQNQIEQEKAKQEAINTKYADANAKAVLAKNAADLADIASNINYRAGQLGVSQGELKVAQQNAATAASKAAKPTATSYESNPDFQNDYAAATSNSANVYKALTTQAGAKAAIAKYGIQGYKDLLTASKPKSSTISIDDLVNMFGGGN